MAKEYYTMDPEIAEYIDRTGCGLETALNELQLNWDDVWDENSGPAPEEE